MNEFYQFDRPNFVTWHWYSVALLFTITTLREAVDKMSLSMAININIRFVSALAQYLQPPVVEESDYCPSTIVLLYIGS